MTTSGRQAAVRRRTVVAIAIAAAVILPLALPAGAANLSSGTAAVTAPPTSPVLDTVDKGAVVVQQLGQGTPVQPATSTVQKTVTGATGTLRQPANPAPNVVPNPQPAPGSQPVPAAGAPNASPGALSDVGSLTQSAGSASGLSVGAATLLLANDASAAAPLVAEALSASPSALVLVAEPLARSLNLPLGNPPHGATTSDTTEEVQASRNLPQGLLTEALIAVALLVAATAALVAELGLKRSAPRAT